MEFSLVFREGVQEAGNVDQLTWVGLLAVFLLQELPKEFTAFMIIRDSLPC
jgi:hypothetical protein